MKTALLLFITLAVLLISCSQDTSQQESFSSNETAHIDILHTNDIHGRLDNMPRLSSSITQIIKTIDDENVLLLDAGDVFSGSIYGTLYQGQASLQFMNRLGYDAICPGNHEFNDDNQSLFDFVQGAEFDIVASNFEFIDKSVIDNDLKPWLIIEKNNEQYGIFGLLTEETSEISNGAADILIDNHTTAAREMVAELERQGINKIIALTHIGWDEDVELAGEVEGIDIIIGGHSHTVPEVYPYVVDADKTPTLVVQAGEHAGYLGHLSVAFNTDGIVTDWTGSNLLQIDETVVEDATFVEMLAEYDAPIEAMMAKVVGYTMVDLDGERTHVRSQETNLGNLVADSMLYDARHTGAEIAVINGGGIRASIPRGDVTLEQAISVLPFDNYLVCINLKGEQILQALENGVSRVEDGEGRFLQVAGLRFTWDPKAEPGRRIVSAEVAEGGVYRPINPRRIYRIVTIKFLYEGGDGYTMFAEGTDFINLANTDYEVLAAYISVSSPIGLQVEGRITRK